MWMGLVVGEASPFERCRLGSTTLCSEMLLA